MRIFLPDMNAENIYLDFCKQNDIQLTRADELAYKLLTGKVSKAEREEIYTLLTGREAPVTKKRGIPANKERDMNIALQQLYRTEKLGLGRVESMNQLAAEYSMKYDGIEDAVSKGLKLLKENAFNILNFYHATQRDTFLKMDDDLSNKISQMKADALEQEEILERIKKYEEDSTKVSNKFTK